MHPYGCDKNTVSVKAFIRAGPTSGFDMSSLQTNSEEWVGVALWGKEGGVYNSWSAYSHTMSVWFIYFRPNSKYALLLLFSEQTKYGGADEQKQFCLCKMFNSFVHYNKPWLHTNITGTDSCIYSVCFYFSIKMKQLLPPKQLFFFFFWWTSPPWTLKETCPIQNNGQLILFFSPLIDS